MTLTFGSLFDGIYGFGLGFERDGLACAWRSEIDKHCDALMQACRPNIPNLGDVQHVGKRNAAAVDVVCGGFPCQDLSVAGKRAGLAGGRSGLWFEFRRIVKELQPRWVVVENVPGLLSSNGGRDFAVILGGLDDLGYGVAWRVLDAQFFGVAQRRRRVFLVASLGSGRALEVLFEPESLSGDIAPHRQAGQRIAAPLTRGSATGRGVNEPGRRQEDDENLVAYTQNSFGGYGEGFAQLRATGGDTGYGGENLVAETLNSGGNRGGFRTEPGAHLVAVNNFAERDVETSLSAKNERLDGDTETFVVQAFAWQQGDESGHQQNGKGRAYIARKGDYAAGLSGTRQDAIAFQQNTRDEVRLMNGDGAIAGALAAEAGMKQQNYIANTLRANAGMPKHAADETKLVSSHFGVRRLTPVECERLQGFPDGWTAGVADSVRYRMLGNAVAVPVAEWIGRRIVQVEET